MKKKMYVSYSIHIKIITSSWYNLKKKKKTRIFKGNSIPTGSFSICFTTVRLNFDANTLKIFKEHSIWYCLRALKRQDIACHQYLNFKYVSV